MKKYQVSDFGRNAEGMQGKLYEFTNEKGMTMCLSDYGATLVKVLVPDSTGRKRDVVLGYDSVSEYEKGGCFFGAIVGRSANRIGGAEFAINEKTYKLTPNDNGKNNLHSGSDFYHLRFWKVENVTDESISLSLHSADMDQGYPGNLDIRVTYTLTEENEVKIQYHGIPDQDTIINMTNHSYFNLNGQGSGDILDHKVMVDADAFTRADEESIPTGELTDVTDTPMDFREKKTVGRDIEDDYEALNLGKGYDHNWVLNNAGTFAKIAELEGDASGIKMEVYTDLPGVQVYTGNFIEPCNGKDGAQYDFREGICFETQYFPDAIHHENFASPICKAGETYETTTVYRFES